MAIEKTYRKGEHKVPVLRGVEVAVRKGEFLSIVGQSGSGKSTLLHLMGLLDTPNVGEILLDGQRIDDLPARTRDELRNRVFGFIFQFYHLLPELSLFENVLAPLMIRHSLWDFWKNRREHSASSARDDRQGRARASAEAPAVGAFGGRNAARGHRPGPGRQAAKFCWPTSRPATSTCARARNHRAYWPA